jgi:tetratricopeptide (TPR) repeat protein
MRETAASAKHSESGDARSAQARKFFDEGIHQREEGNIRYAAYALGRAACEDPAQRRYAKELVATLASPKLPASLLKGLFMSLRLARVMQRQAEEKRWHDLMESTTQLLSVRPRSAAAVLALSQACVGLKCYDSAVVYLHFALKLRPHDIKVNRQCGRVLGKVGMFDEAVACWHRVEERIGKDPEALAEINRLTAKKTGLDEKLHSHS